MNKQLEQALNEQINHELYAAYLYLSMSAYCEWINMPGAAQWMRVQSQEEVGHAMRIFDHLIDRNARVVLQAIEQPPAEFGSLLNVFESALEHERKVTDRIHRLYDLAVQERDYPAQVLLQWFVEEQVEEEKTAQDIVDKLKLIGDFAPGLVMLDAELGGRSPEVEAEE